MWDPARPQVPPEITGRETEAAMEIPQNSAEREEPKNVSILKRLHTNL